LKEAGVDSLVIKELMGHESLATTAIYVQVPLKMQTKAVLLLPRVEQLSEPTDQQSRVPSDRTAQPDDRHRHLR